MRRVIAVCTVCALCAASAAIAATTRTVSAVEGDTLAFSDSKLRSRPGKVTLRMRNPSSLQFEHSIAIRGNGVSRKGPVVQPGGTSTVSARLRTGRYTFYCRVEGHEDDGMKGRLVVR